MMSIDDGLQTERDLIDAIRRNSRRLTLPILLIILKTFAVPFGAFIVGWLASGYIRGWAAENFQSDALNSTTYLSTTLATFALTWIAWRWAERRFGGLRMIRGLGRVSRAVLRVETAIETARRKESPAPEDVSEIDRLAHAAWDTYTEAMRESGLQVDNG
jgi:hypothetical protein